MPDGVPITAGAGTTVATDLIGGSHFQRMKLTFGVDGVAVDVSASDPLPVTGTFFQATQPVSLAAPVSVTGTFWQATQPVSGTVSVSGSVAVTGTFWQATQPVSGTITANAGTGTFAISAASLPLPAGAATSVKQDTLVALFPATIGQKTKAASLAVALASDQGTLAVGGNSVVVGGTFNRPADTTAYASGDLVANSTTAGSVTPISAAAARVNAGTGVIRRVRLTTSKTGLVGTEVFRVHLFKNSPTVTNGDNGVFAAAGIAAIALGRVDVTLDYVYSDGSKGFVATDIVFDAGAATQNIYALIEARGAYTPASGETFTLALEVLQD